MLIFLGLTATPVVMLVASGQDFTRDYDAVHGLCYSKELIDALPPETMLKPVAHADAEDYVDVHDVCCCKKSCESPWSLLPLTAKLKEAALAVISMTADWQFQKGDIECFWDNP